MGQITPNRPPFNPFADFVARRQYEEERRGAAHLSRLGVGSIPFAGATSTLAKGQSNASDQSLLGTTDDITPLRLSPQIPIHNHAAPDIADPTRTDSLLHPAAAPAAVAPLVAGAAAAAVPLEIVEALSGPIGWGFLALTLGAAAYGLSRSSQSVDSPGFGESSKRGGVTGNQPTSIIPPQPGFPGTPLPHQPLPAPTPLPADKPAFENIPPKFDTQSPPFPVIDDDLFEERVRAGSKTPWADAYPEVHDWVKTYVENSKGDKQTQDDIEIIIKTYIKGFRKRNINAKHIGGGSEPEKYYADPDKGRVGSGRPDGSFTVGSEEEPYDFNSHDTWKKDGRTPTARERKGKVNLERLRELWRQDRIGKGGSSKQGRFDMLPKSRYFPSHEEWERFITQQIDRLLNTEFGPPPD